MCGCSAHRAVPPFACGQEWAVEFKFFLDRVPCCRRLKATYVAAVTELCLGITSNNVVVQYLWQPVILLFRGCLLSDGGDCCIAWRCQLDARVAQESMY